MMAYNRTRSHDASDWAARGLATICLLNLNGLFNMMYDRGQVMSLLILCCASILIFRTGRAAWFPPFNLLVLGIGTYLLLGLLFYDPNISVESPSKYLKTYINTLFVLWAMTSYVASLEPGQKLIDFLHFVRNVLLVSASSVLISPLLYDYYINIPPSAHQRMGGFFGNPNEAGKIGLYAVALTLALPFRTRIQQMCVLALTSLAVLATFSKSAMSALIILLVWHLLRTTKGFSIAVIICAGAASIAVIQEPQVLVETIANNSILDLSDHQKSRILAVGQILSGQLDEQTTTGRTRLWGIVLTQSIQNFPWGSGLGSGHSVVGGIMEHGAWQGAHNTFLMIWMEGGILPLLLLSAAFVAAGWSSLRYSRGHIEMTCLFIILISLIGGHTSLGSRYQNIMLALLFGLTAISTRLWSERGRAIPGVARFSLGAGRGGRVPPA